VNYKLSVNAVEQEGWQRADSFMEVGNIAMEQNGAIILRTYDQFVELNAPNRTYTGICELLARRFKSGTKIQIIIK
jgi:hypothetical protein